MMHCHGFADREDGIRFVGDPVDVISGALLETTYDFRLEAPFAFEFLRHYNSDKCGENRGLGWGHRHDLDAELRFTYDNRVGYTGADGTHVSFPLLYADGTRTARLGYQLERVRSNWYRVHLPDDRVLEFDLWRSDLPARLVAISHPAGRVQLYYDRQSGLLTSLVDALGRTVRVDWVPISDPFGGPPRSQISTFTLESSPPGGAAEILLTYHYSSNGHLIGGTDRYGNSFAFDYDANGRMSKLSDRRGYTFHYSYDSRGRCVYSGAEDGVEAVHLEYLDGATIVTLADGGRWLYEHHDNYLARVVDPYGGEHVRELDDDGHLVAEVDAAGRRFTIERDATGKAIGRRDSVGRLWPMGEAPHEPEHYVAQNPREWEFGLLLPTEHGLPIRRDLEADFLPEHIVDALTPRRTGDINVDAAERWKETTVSDVQGLRLRVERLDGRRRSWSYDSSANRTRFTDFDGATWRWTFASWNSVRKIENPLGAVTELTESPRLKPASVVDASGLLTEYGYDLKNRLTSVKRDGAVRETYVRDATDELSEKLDGRGRWLLRFERGDEGRRVTLDMASGERHQLIYDAARRLESGVIETPDGRTHSYAFQYAWGHATRDVRNELGVERTFDNADLAEVRVLGLFATRYRRTFRNTLEIKDPTGAVQRLQVCRGGVVSRRMSNGRTEVTQYHPEGYCVAKIAYTGQGQRWSRHYERSGEGDLLATHDSSRGTHRYSYDTAHRLTGEVLPNGTAYSFLYTPGNTLIEAPGLRGATSSHQRVYDANGSRLEYDERQRVSLRRTPWGTFQFTYDSRDQLLAIHGPGFQWNARYDVLGRRIETTFNGKTTTFYWDGDRLAAEIRPDGQLRMYVYADHLALVPLMFVDYASIHADPKSGKRYFVFATHLGAPELIEDDAGNVVWRARYEAYGTAHVEMGADFHQPIRWPGHYFDEATRLHYVRFRYYSPELGQFLQSDPQGVQGGWNLHAYGQGNPLKYVDVRGFNDCPEREGPNKKKKGNADEEGAHAPPAPDGHAAKPPAKKALKDMSHEELRAHCEERAKALKKAFAAANPEAEEKTTLSVGIVEKNGDPSTRKVVVTTSADNQKLPRPVVKAMEPGEEPRQAPPHIARSPRRDNPNYDENGPKNRVTNPKRTTEPQIVDSDGSRESYTKANRGEPVEGTQHHAEQRMENGAAENGENLLAQQPTKPCCPGCTTVLGEGGNLSKVPNPTLAGW
ncbi:DUF6531 domain-containing protein [Pendulispora brunnea]|uniref:DUF6531 domain-containing protein n=1 Tax=Pendulispora brunnea TaxID=2905690 RepID=A0ABZ2KKF6_9BACT